MKQTTFLYCLCEPGTKEIRYIGKANNPDCRRSVHLNHAKADKQTYCARWIRQLLNRGLSPDMHILAEVAKTDWIALEKAFIFLCRHYGLPLTNLAEGGEGPTGHKQTAEHRKNHSLAISGTKNRLFGKRGKEHPAFGYKHSVETRKKMSEMRSGRGNAFFGRTHSSETRLKLSRATKLQHERNKISS